MKLERFAMGSLWTNGYLVYDGAGTGFFVDPGGDPQEVIEVIRKRCIRLEYIFLTHGHADHIAGVEKMRVMASSGILIHEYDSEMLTLPESNLSAFVGERLQISPAESVFQDGDSFEAGDISVKVIHTPGHTMGSCCFLVEEKEEQKVLLSGDTLFAGSVGRTDLPGGDGRDMALSLGKLSMFPDTLAVAPGHGPGTSIGEERKNNPFWPVGQQ